MGTERSSEASAAALVTAAALATELGLTHTVARWLLRQGHRDIGAVRQFLEPKLRSLTAPDQMADRAVAAQRIAAAIRGKQRVVLFGDYDCDGITSTAILTEVLEALGGRVKPLLASRFAGGYGLSQQAVERVLALSPDLLITCDCGSSDHESLRQLRERGVDCVVIDHHLVPDEPLPAMAFLNPHRPECGFPYKGLASCGLALSIAAALRQELKADLDLRRWLDLVAIGTIADVAPLNGDNRILVRAGLVALQKPERPGLRALLALAKINAGAPLTGRDVAFRLAPHLNAPGRMGAPDLALQLLLARDDVSAQRVIAELEQVSLQRREQQERMSEEAVLEIETHGYQHDPAIVVASAGWNPGVVGIVAGRLAERFQKPVVVIGFEGEVGRGSVRGPEGARLHEALSQLKDCLVRFGGHQAAAGLELLKERLPELRQRFAEAVRQQAAPATLGASSNLELELVACDRPLDVLCDLDRLEPCGAENPRPRLKIEGRVLQAREVKGGHLKLELDIGRPQSLGAFSVNQGQLAQTLLGDATVVGDLRRTSFPGAGGVEIFAEEIRSITSSERVASQVAAD